MTTNRIDNLVEIDATISAGAGPGPDFGRVMLVTTDERIGSDDRALEFDDANAVAKKFVDGDILDAAQSYFRQSPTPPPLKVGKWFKNDQTSRLTGAAPSTLAAIQALGATWTLSINGESISAALLGSNVISTEITAGGTGYDAASTVTFSAPTTGVTATGTLVLSGGVVTGITITNAGSGYTAAPTVTIAGVGTGATATAAIGPSTLANAAAGVEAAVQTATATALSAATVTYATTTSRFVLDLSSNGVFTVQPSGTLAAALGWTTGAIVNGHTAETIPAGMSDVVDESQFYWLNLSGDIDDEDDIVAFAEWATAANKKFFVWQEDQQQCLGCQRGRLHSGATRRPGGKPRRRHLRQQ